MSNTGSNSKAPSSEYNFRIIIVGDSTVGKTSLLLRFVDNTFRGDNVSTNGAEVKSRSLAFNKKNLKIDIVDTRGQEMFRTISRSIYRDADAAIVVYDQANEKSFQNAHFWLREVERYGQSHCKTVLAANKSDMHATVPLETGKAFAVEKGIPFFDTSAKDDKNVDAMFQAVIQAVGTSIHQAEDWTKFKIVKPDQGSSNGSSSSSSSNSNNGATGRKKSPLCTIL